METPILGYLYSTAKVEQPYMPALRQAMETVMRAAARRGDTAKMTRLVVDHVGPDGTNLVPEPHRLKHVATANPPFRVIVKHEAPCAADVTAAWAAGSRPVACSCKSPAVQVVEATERS